MSNLTYNIRARMFTCLIGSYSDITERWYTTQLIDRNI